MEFEEKKYEISFLGGLTPPTYSNCNFLKSKMGPLADISLYEDWLSLQ